MPKIREIVGHKTQVDHLLGDMEHENIAHAYLFSGPEHLGKMTIARWFAYQLVSYGMQPERQEIVKKQVERMMHPDVLVLDKLWIEGVNDNWDELAKWSNAPQAHRAKKPAAKTDAISIDDVRALQDRLYETGTGLWRVCIIRSMERMQSAAANAFLKILEEPPKGVVFLLTTEHQSALLPTIISRSRVISFRRLPRTELRTLLDGVPEDDAQFILHIARGAPGNVMRLLKDPDALREQRTAHAAAQSFWRATTLQQRLRFLKPLQERSEAADDFLLHLALALRERSPDLSFEHVEALQELSQGLRTNAHRQLLVQQFALQV